MAEPCSCGGTIRVEHEDDITEIYYHAGHALTVVQTIYDFNNTAGRVWVYAQDSWYLSFNPVTGDVDIEDCDPGYFTPSYKGGKNGRT